VPTLQANRCCRLLISTWLGTEDWLRDLDMLRRAQGVRGCVLRARTFSLAVCVALCGAEGCGGVAARAPGRHVDNPKLHAQWMDVKRGAKERLARYIKRELASPSTRTRSSTCR